MSKIQLDTKSITTIIVCVGEALWEIWELKWFIIGMSFKPLSSLSAFVFYHHFLLRQFIFLHGFKYDLHVDDSSNLNLQPWLPGASIHLTIYHWCLTSDVQSTFLPKIYQCFVCIDFYQKYIFCYFISFAFLHYPDT